MNKLYGEITDFSAQSASSSHPLSQEGLVSVFPEVEEFLLMLYGFGLVTLLFIDPCQHVEAHV